MRIRSRNGADDRGVAVDRQGREAAQGEIRMGDGEVRDVARWSNQLPATQNALSDSTGADLTYFVFDLPYVDGYDLRNVPERAQAVLRGVVPAGDPAALRRGGAGQRRSVHRAGVQARFRRRGVEEIASTYKDGVRTASGSWPVRQAPEMVIGGFTDPQGSRAGFGAPLLGVYEPDGTLRYSVASEPASTIDYWASAARSTSSSATSRRSSTRRADTKPRVYWVEPRLVGEVSFTEWTDEERCATLRSGTAQGQEGDRRRSRARRRIAWAGRQKPATKMATEAATKVSAKAAMKTSHAPAPGVVTSSKTSTKDMVVVAGVTISHPDKMLFPEAKLTKRDLASYYEKISPWLVPHLAGRPLSLVRCPDGWKNQCFYQKHADKSVNAEVTRVDVPEGKTAT